VSEAWSFLDGDKPIVVRPHGRFTANNAVALSAAVLAGVGIALMPDFLVDSHLKSGALVPLLTKFPVAEGGIYIVRPAAVHPSGKVRALIEIMQQFFSSHPEPETRAQSSRPSDPSLRSPGDHHPYRSSTPSSLHHVHQPRG
jgi:DNA-binding transcriptional LysR family regulator